MPQEKEDQENDEDDDDNLEGPEPADGEKHGRKVVLRAALC